jgi:toxin ParE1/3/4
MKYRIKLTHAFRRDLLNAFDYIADELKNPAAANRLIDDAEKAVDSLCHMPFAHPPVMDEFLSGRGIRLIPVNNYIVFYVVREESRTAVILRFLYGRRDWQSILTDRGE